MKPIGPQQVDAAALTLAEAFRDDPLMRLFHPDEDRRNAAAPWFHGCAIKVAMPFGQVWADEDTSAVAVWLPPDGTDLSLVRMLRAGIAALPLKIGPRRALTFMQAISSTEEYHKAVGPHWYLLSVGTRPERQGQGLGSALLEVGTAQADAAGLPCYLDTMTDEDIAFYSKRGFEIKGQVEVQGYTATAMVRQPKPSTAD